jgi:signal transduction histidine kinase
MSDTELQPRPKVQRIVIRSWPKIVLMMPTLIVAALCGIIMGIYGAPEADAAFGGIHLAGLLFLVVLLINLTILLYDLSLRGFLIVVLLIVVLVLALFLISTRHHGIWQAIGRALSVKVYANAAFYFLFALALFFNLLIAFIITRFHYWEIEHNEIIIHHGFMSEQERHPTAQARFKLVIEDVVEYALLGSGKLVFYFGDDKSERVLTTVPFVHRKAKMLDELLGRVAVTEQ